MNFNFEIFSSRSETHSVELFSPIRLEKSCEIGAFDGLQSWNAGLKEDSFDIQGDQRRRWHSKCRVQRFEFTARVGVGILPDGQIIPAQFPFPGCLSNIYWSADYVCVGCENHCSFAPRGGLYKTADNLKTQNHFGNWVEKRLFHTRFINTCCCK